MRARDETANVVSIVTRPSARASNSMFSVMSFDIEAGGRGVSAFLSITACSAGDRPAYLALFMARKRLAV